MKKIDDEVEKKRQEFIESIFIDLYNLTKKMKK